MMSKDTSVWAMRIKRQVLESARVQRQVAEELSDEIASVAFLISDCLRSGGKLIVFGNGGSAADAQHIACEFVGRFKLERAALPAIALSTNSSVITALGNDYGFKDVFARQVEAWAKTGDVVMGISTSGNSENVLEGIRRAKAMNANTIGLTGGDGGQLARIADAAIVIPSCDTPRIQEAHITIAHVICYAVERMLFGTEGQRAVFLDRDGVINENLDGDYVKSWREFAFIPGAIEAIKRLTNGGWDLIVISNQSGINRGIVSAETVEDVHGRMLREICSAGGRIKALYYCPHRPDENCDCRKPEPGLVLKAAEEHDIDLGASYLVGDAIRDIEAGVRAGCRTILVMTGRGTQELKERDKWVSAPDYIVPDLGAAADVILGESAGRCV
jgi:D-sedoheptulose 7-phosphate isomerase